MCRNPASAVPQPCSSLPLPLQPFSRLPAPGRVLLGPTPQHRGLGEPGSCHAEEPLQTARCSSIGGSRWLLGQGRFWGTSSAKQSRSATLAPSVTPQLSGLLKNKFLFLRKARYKWPAGTKAPIFKHLFLRLSPSYTLCFHGVLHVRRKTAAEISSNKTFFN